MKINDITKKVTECIYEVSVENVCDSIRGYFTDLEAAKKQAHIEKTGERNNVVIVKMQWSDEEEEYVYTYDENGGLDDIVYSI